MLVAHLVHFCAGNAFVSEMLGRTPRHLSSLWRRWLKCTSSSNSSGEVFLVVQVE